MDRLIGRKDAAKTLGISVATLDAIRNKGLISFIQYVENGRVYFTESGLQEYLAKSLHRPLVTQTNRSTYRRARAI